MVIILGYLYSVVAPTEILLVEIRKVLSKFGKYPSSRGDVANIRNRPNFSFQSKDKLSTKLLVN